MASYNLHEFKKEIAYLYPRLNRAVSAWLAGSKIEPEDILQEVFLKAWKNLPRFQGEASLYTWLFSIARNLCIDELRKQKSRKKISPIPVEDFELEADRFSNEDEREEILLLRKAIAELPEMLRSVVIMKSIDGMTYPEISQINGVNVQTLKNRMFRARKLLAESLKKMGVNEP